jgi:Flp pilus assembly protein CpaB
MRPHAPISPSSRRFRHHVRHVRRLLFPLGFWMITLIVALVSARIVHGGVSPASTLSGSTKPVVVATVDLAPGHQLTAADVVVKQVPASLIPSHATRRVAVEVIGQRVVQPIDAGTMLTTSMISDRSTSALAARIGNKHRGMIIDFAGPALPVSTGDHVDVVVSRDGDGQSETVATDVVIVERIENSVLLSIPEAQVTALATGLARGRPMLALRGG